MANLYSGIQLAQACIHYDPGSQIVSVLQNNGFDYIAPVTETDGVMLVLENGGSFDKRKIVMVEGVETGEESGGQVPITWCVLNPSGDPENPSRNFLRVRHVLASGDVSCLAKFGTFSITVLDVGPDCVLEEPIVIPERELHMPANPATEAWARNIVRQALKSAGFVSSNGEPTLSQMQIVQAVSRGEGYYGKASNPPEWAGSNNWGAVTCCSVPSDGECPAGSFKTKDSRPADDGSVIHYEACFKSYPTPEMGCEDMLRIMTRTPEEKTALRSGDPRAVCRAMYQAKYYTTNKKDPDAAIDEYATKLEKNIEAIANALGEPIGWKQQGGGGGGGGGGGVSQAKKQGDLFPLLLATIPLGSMLLHGVGDPLVVTRDMAYAEVEKVRTNMNRTDDAFNKAMAKHVGITFEEYIAWTRFYEEWSHWYQTLVLDRGVSVVTAPSIYSEAHSYDNKRYEWVKLLESRGVVVGPKEVDPKTEDKGSELGDALKLGAGAIAFFSLAKLIRG